MRNYFLKTLFGSALLIMILAGCGGGSGSTTSGGGGGSVGGGGGGVITASVGLEWEAPTTKADGTPLGDLSGYKILYGTTPGSYSSSVNVGLSTTCTIDGLVTGDTYFFVVIAYDASGNESELSNEISMVI